MLLLTKYLREHSLEELKSEYKLFIKQDREYPELFLFRYDMINSPMGDPLVQECRGVILNSEDNWNIVSLPYYKFFNMGESLAHEIDWSSAKTYEKLDGSIINMYWYDGKWRVATSGTPDGLAPLPNIEFKSDKSEKTFRELFWEVWDKLGYELPDEGYKGHTFMFELMTPENIIIVQHKDYNIALHGMPNLSDLQEYTLEAIEKMNFGWKLAKTYDFKDETEVVQAADALNGLEDEGFVVRDANFNRVKIKCADYLRIKYLRIGHGLERKVGLSNIVRQGESSEVLQYFPHLKAKAGMMKKAYDQLIEEILAEYEPIKRIESQKEFALFVQKNCKYKSMMFYMRQDGGSPEALKNRLKELPIKIFYNLIEGVDIEKPKAD